MEYRHGSHTIYNIEYHFVWVTKYRYKTLTGDVGLRVKELVRQTCTNNWEQGAAVHTARQWPCCVFSTAPKSKRRKPCTGKV